MPVRHDILLDENNDLIIENGDFKIGESDQQHQQAIIATWTGQWKEFPLLGIGINYYLGGSGLQQELIREMRIQLTDDGYKFNSVDILDNNFYVDATIQD